MGDFVSGPLHTLYQVVLDLLTSTIVLIGLAGSLASTLEATLKKFRKLRDSLKGISDISGQKTPRTKALGPPN